MNEAPALPYGLHTVEDDDIAAIAAALRSGWLTGGPEVTKFEAAFAEAVGAPYAIACSSGTAALHLAMLALGIGPGEAVVVPAITFAATANCARYVGAEPIFADVDPDTGLMEGKHLEAALAGAAGKRVRAVIPVHLAGQPAPLAEIADIARDRDIAVVEDACHALGSRYIGDSNTLEPIGACRHSAMATFSTHPVKTVTTGEGGVVTTRDAEIAQRAARLRNHGIVREPENFADRNLAFASDGSVNPWYYEVQETGFNYRASDIHCALGTSQLKKLPRFVERRRALVARYDAALVRLAPRVLPLRRRNHTETAWHLYLTLIDFAACRKSRAEVMRRMRMEGVGTQVHYIPLPLQPAFRGEDGVAFPGAMRYYERALTLPLFPSMQDEDVDRVVAALENALA